MGNPIWTLCSLNNPELVQVDLAHSEERVSEPDSSLSLSFYKDFALVEFLIYIGMK